MRGKKSINIEVGNRLQLARERADYTQERLSELIGVTPNHLSAIERGASGISLEALQKICAVLGISADFVLFGEENREDESLALAKQLSRVPSNQRAGVRKVLSALLELTMNDKSSGK